MALTGLLVGLAYAVGGVATPVDAVAYWQAGTSAELYPTHWSQVGAGLLFYPPPVAQVSALLQPIGYPVFIVGLMTLIFVCVWYCARRWSFPLLLLGIPYYLGVGPVESATFLGYALLGNLQWPLAAVTVLALRRPSLYPALVLTKITPSIGWWWHVFREEWRQAAIGASATLLVLGLSVATAFDQWVSFVGFASRNLTMVDPPLPLFPVPLFLRLPTGIVLLMWGARTDRPWVVPVAAGWVLPALYGLGFLPFWVAATRLIGDDRRHREPAESPAAITDVARAHAST